ncbi:unnamed protein product [Mytilus edulis]|uniref:Uncharacterized protein n=1 Tax=Mytilus edulis TaxID=6550 RepID=A0A8S3UZP7_MYTED|nr:unnamed protein product [Mytilus edulis]
MHITSNKNCIADAISRQQWPRFRRMSPEALQEPEKVPQSFSSSDLKFESNKLLTASISPNTSDTYETAVRSFDQFRSSHGHAIVWPPSLNVICNFIAYLSVRGYAPSTAKSYIFDVTKPDLDVTVTGINNKAKDKDGNPVSEVSYRVGRKSDDVEDVKSPSTAHLQQSLATAGKTLHSRAPKDEDNDKKWTLPLAIALGILAAVIVIAIICCCIHKEGQY